MTGVRIRRGSLADRDQLVAFNRAMAIETEARQLDAAVLAEGIGRLLAEPARGFYLVAECEGVVAGCLMITFEWSDWRNGDWWWLQSVFVAPAFRRRGVYRALHDEIEQVARSTSDVVGLRLYVERDNRRAQATYGALGMHAAAYVMWEREFPRRG